MMEGGKREGGREGGGMIPMQFAVTYISWREGRGREGGMMRMHSVPYIHT